MSGRRSMGRCGNTRVAAVGKAQTKSPKLMEPKAKHKAKTNEHGHATSDPGRSMGNGRGEQEAWGIKEGARAAQGATQGDI